MGSCISAILDDYDSYLYLCKLKGITPYGSRDSVSFYDHAEQIIEAFTKEEREEHKNNYSINSLHAIKYLSPLKD